MYEINPVIQKRLDNDYMYHPPFGTQQERYEILRNAAKQMAELIITLSPPSREQSVALTHLDELVMNTNAAIARNEQQ